jgi:putative membrane protein
LFRADPRRKFPENNKAVSVLHWVSAWSMAATEGKYKMKLHKRMSVPVIAGLALALGAGLVFAADNAEHGQLSSRDYKFLKEAASGGMAEVEVGQLAKTKGTDPSVRAFGERMVTDHQKANDELKQIASTKGATIPSEISHSERSTIDKLQKAEGAQFDKEFASAMVKDHKKDVKDFKDAADDVKDAELKAFAQKTLATLQEHLRMAEDMAKTVKAETSTTSSSTTTSTGTRTP